MTVAATVLVVEDEPLIRWTIAEDLRDAGFTVVEAANADDAIKCLIDNRQISVVFTDIDMPGSMDGLKLAEFVRDRWPPIRIIVTSGNWRGADVALLETERFLTKPYDSKIVARTISQLVLG